MFFLSLPVPSQSDLVTTTGTGNASHDALNISPSTSVSNISNIIPVEILKQEIQGESDEFKDLVSDELENLEKAEEQEKKERTGKTENHSSRKVLLLWCKKKRKRKS